MNFTDKEKKYVALIGISLVILLFSAFIPGRDYELGFGLEIIPNAFEFSNWFKYITRVIYNLIFWVNIFLLTFSLIKKGISSPRKKD